VLVSDPGNNVVWAVAASTGTFYGQAMTAGDIYTIAGNGTSGFSGSGGPATMAEFSNVGGATVDKHGNVLVSDPGNNVVWAVAASTGTFYGQAMTAGDIYVVAGGGTAILGDGGPATAAQLAGPAGVAVSATGSLLVADGADNRLRAITVAGFPSGRDLDP
jgi:serine/threonine-protein kinase